MMVRSNKVWRATASSVEPLAQHLAKLMREENGLRRCSLDMPRVNCLLREADMTGEYGDALVIGMDEESQLIQLKEALVERRPRTGNVSVRCPNTRARLRLWGTAQSPIAEAPNGDLLRHYGGFAIRNGALKKKQYSGISRIWIFSERSRQAVAVIHCGSVGATLTTAEYELEQFLMQVHKRLKKLLKKSSALPVTRASLKTVFQAFIGTEMTAVVRAQLALLTQELSEAYTKRTGYDFAIDCAGDTSDPSKITVTVSPLKRKEAHGATTKSSTGA